MQHFEIDDLGILSLARLPISPPWRSYTTKQDVQFTPTRDSRNRRVPGYSSVGVVKRCLHGMLELLSNRRGVVIVSEVIVDGREILGGVAFPHREAIQFFHSIGHGDGYTRFVRTH